MKKTILIAIPCHRMIQTKTLIDLMDTISSQNTEHHIGYYLRIGDGLISRVRNEMGKTFLEAERKWDYLMFIDDDITWDATKKPIDQLIKANKDIIAGVYPIRDGTCRPAIRTLQDQKLILAGKYTGKKMKFPFKKAFKAEYVSTGFMLMKRAVVEKVYGKHQYPFQPYAPHGEYLSEDWAFCHRAKELGIECWVDPTIELGHIGDYTYTIKPYFNT